MRDDVELLAAWRAGDARSGEALFERYFDQLSRFFVNKVPFDHEDLIQETFTAVVGGRDRLRRDASFRSYLFSTAFNVLKKYFARKAKVPPTSLEELAVEQLAPGPSTLLRANEQELLLLESLRCIPLELQVVLEMSYWEGMASAEIGEALGIPAGTVRTRMMRGRDRLAQELRRRGGEVNALADLDDWAQRIRGLMEGGGSAGRRSG